MMPADNNYMQQVTASTKQEKEEELPTALPIAISSTSKSWEPHGNAGKSSGRSNVQYPGGSRAQFHQELGSEQHQDQGHGKTVSQYEKGYQYGVGKAALDKHVENALLKSELYGDPCKFPYHIKLIARSYRPELPFVMPPDDLTSSRSRLKRDLELDPEDVLTVLSLWEAEHRAKSENNPSIDPSWFSYYGLDTPDPFQEEELENEEDDDSSQIDGGWLEGPVAHPSSSSHRYRLERRGGYYYPLQYPYPTQKRDSSQWGGFAKDKRFMVSTPRDEVQTLAQLLNHPYRDPGVPLYRRVVL
ncbi:hypothetical protein C0J52_17889 [Blattella germanica]|nr:hypothetical protein C0J52_17889 [Blattella germanica]